ncbi:MAG: HAD family phosphatase [Alphaproteobacteria bacterium]|nr:HAD family phosphatase [Alphaproteobacteria bacterium]
MKPLFAHLRIPASTTAILWDMDGVLLNSLQHDIDICAPLFTRHLQRPISFSENFIRSIFAHDPIRFIDALLEQTGTTLPQAARATLLNEYLAGRRDTPFPLLPGVRDVLSAAKAQGLKQTVVSNNATDDIKSILQNSKIADYFESVVGNDLTHNGKPILKKPAPDMYLHGAELLGVTPEQCVVFEDSVLGCTAGLCANAHVIGLLTGSAGQDELRTLQPQTPHQIYPSLIEKPL